MRAFPEKLLHVFLWTALLGAGAWLAVRWVLPWIWPFLIAWGVAELLEPLVGRLCRQGVGRPLAAGICMLVLAAAAASLAWLLLGRALEELGELLPRLPDLLRTAEATLRGWKEGAEGWLERLPEGVRALAGTMADGALDSLGRLPAALTGQLPALLSALASAAPEALLFTVTTVIGAYFLSASYPELLHTAARLLPDRFLCRARLLRRDLRSTLGRWLRAQGLMTLITCALLAAAFLLLGLRYALLLALLTAVVDALPVLGTGTVLIPWALYELLTGNPSRGIGLAVTYGAVTLLRSSIQAKLLGDQLGLHPLTALAAVYAGWRLGGVWGMLLFPIGAICVKQALPGIEAWSRG